ncbi:Poly(A) RNA polymerase cid14 [Glycine soja]
MGDLLVNGVVFGEDRPCASSPPSPPLPPSNPDPSSVAADAWAAAEKTTAEILSRIRPTLAADRRRREVVDYVQRLIRYGARCEVFPYGSVPLKTYLPDGDIDLTALSCQNIEDGLVSDVRAVLHGEEINEASEYEVKDVRFIDAEVKLVKCIVQDIVVDISFNQLGGLSTLCFLEKVDRLVAKDHLFKRSIILIKAWCYYESRVLGAHHGLISTYALETLVLYIFHQFHVSLDGPLAVSSPSNLLDHTFSSKDGKENLHHMMMVMHPFSKNFVHSALFPGSLQILDYFSKFDWDNYCVSLKGPVGKSSPPNIVGNFYRIRSAFKYGARKLGWILMLPEDRITEELIRFFTNTLERHGSTPGNVNKSFLSLSTASRKDRKPENQHNYDCRDERERYVVQDAGEFFDSSRYGNAVGSLKLCEDSKDVATSGVLDSASTNGWSYCSNGQFENNISDSEPALNSVIDDEKEKQGVAGNSPRSHTDEKNMAVSEASKSLLDLTGDYDSHIGNLQYGHMCNGYPVSPVVPSPPRSPKFPNRNPWETVRQCVQINHSIRSQANSNSVMGQQVYVINHPSLPMTSFGSEEKRKVRGTGAYFPNMTSRPYRDNRPMPGRGRGQAPGTHGHLQRHTRNNGFALAPQEMNLSAEGTFEHALEGYPGLGSTKIRSSETYFPQPSTWGSHYANGFVHSSEKHESVHVSPQLQVVPRNETSIYPESVISTPRGTVPNTGEVMEKSDSLSVVDSKRIEEQAYRLKNDVDFPPLSH